MIWKNEKYEDKEEAGGAALYVSNHTLNVTN